MSFFDKIFGRKKAPRPPRRPTAQPRPGYPQPPQSYPPQQSQQYGIYPPVPPRQPGRSRPSAMSPAEQAQARYRYMLRTAPPATIEQVHAGAFAQFTPQQRHVMMEQLSMYLTPEERAAGLGVRDDPDSLAHAATLIEIRRPGTLESIYRGMSNMILTPAATSTTSKRTSSNDAFLNLAIWLSLSGMVAHEFFADPMYGAGFDPAGVTGYGAGDGGSGDLGGDIGGGDFGGGDFGGDLGGLL